MSACVYKWGGVAQGPIFDQIYFFVIHLLLFNSILNLEKKVQKKFYAQMCTFAYYGNFLF